MDERGPIAALGATHGHTGLALTDCFISPEEFIEEKNDKERFAFKFRDLSTFGGWITFGIPCIPMIPATISAQL